MWEVSPIILLTQSANTPYSNFQTGRMAPNPERIIPMSIELKNLIQSIELLTNMRYQAVGIDYAWNKLHNAAKHLQNQVAAQFAE